MSVCLWPPPFNLWMPQPIFLKICILIMAPEPISTACFINPSHQSVYPNIIARQGLSQKRYRGNEYIRNNRRIVVRAVFYVVRVLPNESKRLVLPRTACYIRNYWQGGEIKTSLQTVIQSFMVYRNTLIVANVIQQMNYILRALSEINIRIPYFLLSLFFDHEVSGRTFLRNTIELTPDYTASQFRIQYSSELNTDHQR
jgi:hypothetical protein